MIDEIQVQNLALIKEASFRPCAGLTVITGETGAGKTALLSALKLLMGVRASADMVRDGANQLSVSGRFYGLAAGKAMSAGEPSQDAAELIDSFDETIVARSVSADGRSRASVDGAMASVHELAQIVGPSVDLCGQFEHQQLMRTSTHVHLLDALESETVSEAASAYRQAFADAQAAAAELERVREASEISQAKLEDARFALRRIDEVDPREGEYDEIRQELARAEHAEQLALAIGTAREALSGDSGALDALGTAISALDSAGSVDASLADLAQSLREAGYALEDAAATVRGYEDGIEFDPEDLERKQERISQLQGLLRTFGPTMEAVFARREQAAETVALVDEAGSRLSAAEDAVAKAEEVLSAAADALDAARAKAAPHFEAAVQATMDRLEMKGAALQCVSERLAREAWTPTGPSSVEFKYRPGEGMQARPLVRIASGGEVSRMMLAVKVALGSSDDVDTLVFDEVDAGVGGVTAVALADVIADLARTHQVIVVTHLPQVAARADAHYVVRRTDAESGAAPETVLSPVEGVAREDEIARMLSGTVTEASRAHARELLGI